MEYVRAAQLQTRISNHTGYLFRFFSETGVKKLNHYLSKFETLLTNLPNAVSYEHLSVVEIFRLKGCFMALVVSLLLNVDHFKDWLLTNLML